jgi:hypothetical protein
MRLHLAGSVGTWSPHQRIKTADSMRVHLAGQIGAKFPAELEGEQGTMPASGKPWGLCSQSLTLEQYQHALVTYAYPSDITRWGDVWLEVPQSTVIVDSGAFTAHSKGIEYTCEGYAEFIDEFNDTYAARLREVNFMSLDVIGQPEATWRNFERLEQLGKTVMPVITVNCSTSDVDRAAEHGYIACGGLVGAGEPVLKRWLDGVFARLMKRATLPRVHLLGVTQEWALKRYPIFSCDSSSWIKPVRFGQSRLAGLRKIPNYLEGAPETALAIESLRHEVRRYAKLERDTTELWRKRGIEWPD